MAYSIEKGSGDIVINGWEKGVGLSPYLGIGALKNINISTIAGEASVNFGRTLTTPTAISGGTITASGADNSLAYAGTTPLIPGTWVQVAAGSTITNFTSTTGYNSGPYFFVKDLLTGTTTNGTFAFQLTAGNSNLSGTAIANFGLTGSATFSTYNMGNLFLQGCTEYVSAGTYRYYMVDAIGLIWMYPYVSSAGNSWVLTDSPNTGNRANAGIFTFYGYLFRASDGSGGSGGATSFEWKPTTSLKNNWTNFAGGYMNNTSVPHKAVVGVQDNTAWICDGQYIDELVQVEGKTFDPTDGTTYVYTKSSIVLWNYETAQCIAELGSLLVMGGISNNLYLFDRSSTNVTGAYTVLPLVEGNVQNMVNAGNVVYLFVGSKGHIYVTSGAIASPVLNIPDYVTGQIEPYYTWGAAVFMRGRIFFSLKDSNSATGGVWSFAPIQGAFIEQDIGTVLRLENIASYNTYGGYTTVILPLAGATGQAAHGPQYYSGWYDGVLTYGIDSSSTSPYTGGQAIIETDFINTGTFLNKKTFNNIEYKLATPLVANESVIIKYRNNLTSAFASLPTFITETNSVSAYCTMNFEKVQWIQLEAILTSTATNPSFCRLTELRIR